MNFTIASLVAIMLSLNTSEVSAIKFNKAMNHRLAQEDMAVPDDVDLPDFDEFEDMVDSMAKNADIDWDLVEGKVQEIVAKVATVEFWDTLVCEAGEFEIAGTCEICPAGFMSFNDS